MSWFVVVVVGRVIKENNQCVVMYGVPVGSGNCYQISIDINVVLSVDRALRIEYRLNFNDGTCSTLSS